MKTFRNLSIEEFSHLERLTIQGEHENLYDFLDEHNIRFDANPMTREGYCLRQQGETLLNWVFKIESKEKSDAINSILKIFGASHYRGPHYTELNLVLPIQILQYPCN